LKLLLADPTIAIIVAIIIAESDTLFKVKHLCLFTILITYIKTLLKHPSRPVICFDERPCQMIGDSIVPLPIKPGSTKKEHYEYQRNGTCCIFMSFEPRAGKRLTYVSERRTKVDYANFMKMLAKNYLDAKAIALVQDNLNLILPVHFTKLYRQI
jgi:hypothetical protein